MNTKTVSSPDHDHLYRTAEAQAGYFTAVQARHAGFSRALLSYHARTNLFDRIRPGIYRLKRFPASPNEDLFVAWLRVGPHSVISHDSALALYDLSDLLPDAIHLIVPRTASRRHPGLRLHTNRLESGDVTQYAGLPVTSVPRTIVDMITRGLSEELVRQAIDDALRRGMVTADQLRDAANRQGGRALRLIELTLATVNVT
ncbi:MAG: type IV toxin-antitoxin system AbiEi family antitoxin domain-containing protein [Caldilineaceae bacterium]|nr:type IV toxin-antitoxin system AbiEi family antitoxin domain-containing protein [Caldilineaceae bacterium]MBP8109265.1 type IV toxin-antitoxin system AbiEi family antitoxin domain-containing protein [Caldilineaceae bacterium]MBP8123904.1 type IV toxin-antitoxin system AbiEi family antitoxin domain-containing protein [Caldilineaceae bacterium]MBP9071833.1 type IV toxin-antitoxin system AbiEi family antitoxin domain-containing protein [Caldilineaceae bacterium]